MYVGVSWRAPLGLCMHQWGEGEPSVLDLPRSALPIALPPACRKARARCVLATEHWAASTYICRHTWCCVCCLCWQLRLTALPGDCPHPYRRHTAPWVSPRLARVMLLLPWLLMLWLLLLLLLRAFAWADRRWWGRCRRRAEADIAAQLPDTQVQGQPPFVQVQGPHAQVHSRQ